MTQAVLHIAIPILEPGAGHCHRFVESVCRRGKAPFPTCGSGRAGERDFPGGNAKDQPRRYVPSRSDCFQGGRWNHEGQTKL